MKVSEATEVFYEVTEGVVTGSSISQMPAAFADRLYLVNASGIPAFRPAYDALTQMGFYSINPDSIRDFQLPGSSGLLARDGNNITSVLRRIEADGTGGKQRIEEYLGAAVAGVTDIGVKSFGPKETINFHQKMSSDAKSVQFLASSMSDGTLRALGNLIAMFQTINGNSRRPSLIGIEEPETALHPAASGVLLDALREASQTTQVIVTSHSPDLLDNDEIPQEQILAVELQNGATQINHIDEGSRTLLQDHLTTPGELLRLNQLQPEPMEAKPG